MGSDEVKEATPQTVGRRHPLVRRQVCESSRLHTVGPAADLADASSVMRPMMIAGGSRTPG